MDHLVRLVRSAWSQVVANDQYLLTNSAHERNVAGRLAVYLDDLFPGYSIDPEHNRMGSLPKRLAIGGPPSLVYPDIIVHRRGEIDNLLVMELKWTSASADDRANDRAKIEAFILDENFQYRFGIFLEFDTDGRFSMEIAQSSDSGVVWSQTSG